MHISSDKLGPALETVLGPLGRERGVELFYNRQVKEWLHVTPDLQVLVPAREIVDSSIVVGLRAVMQL